VLKGQACPEGLGAVVYHGMLRGLALMLTGMPASNGIPLAPVPAVRPVPHERQFVRLLANMLLRTQSEVMHVY
jgi:hypothetical protein